MSKLEKKIILNALATLFVIGFAVSIYTAARAALVEQRPLTAIVRFLILAAIFCICSSAWSLSRLAYKWKRAGQRLFDAWIYRISAFKILLVVFAVVNVYQIAIMLIEPGYEGLFLELIMFSLVLVFVSYYLVGSGIYEKGIILNGNLMIWYNIKAFKMEPEWKKEMEITFLFKINSNDKGQLVKLKCRFNPEDRERIRDYMERRMISEHR